MLDKSRKTMTFKLLSVAENDYKSDTLAAVSVYNYYGAGGGSGCIKTKVEVSDRRKITITSTDGNKSTSLEIKNTDIESLIEFLKDAQLFVSESELFNAIRGK
jgi:hypothetical protein